MNQPTHSSPLPPVPPLSSGGMPPLLHFLALNLGTGLSIGIAVAALLVMFNVGELKTLISGAEDPWLAISLLYLMCAMTFGSLGMGVAVMSLPYELPPDRDEPGNGSGDQG